MHPLGAAPRRGAPAQQPNNLPRSSRPRRYGQRSLAPDQRIYVERKVHRERYTGHRRWVAAGQRRGWPCWLCVPLLLPRP